MPINQPSNQIKLTNVSLVRMRKGKKRFELACYQNKVQDYRNQVEKDLDEVLQIHQVFLNTSKGQVAPKDDLQKCFGTTDVDTIIAEILIKGEIQLSEKEREIKTNNITNEMLQIISAKCINPKSKKRYPPTMIHKALVELKFQVLATKSAKSQALEAIRILIAKQIMPIVRAQMKIKVAVALDSPLREKLALLVVHKPEDVAEAAQWECTGLVDPVNYREIVELINSEDNATVQVLDMAVVEQS